MPEWEGIMNNKNDEVSDLVGSFPKYESYKKKYGRGYNFDFKLAILRYF